MEKILFGRNLCGDVNEKKSEEIIKQYENYTGKTPNNCPSRGAPGTTLQKNAGETINMKEYRSLSGQKQL